MVSRFLTRYLLIPIILLWVYHLSQRAHQKTVGAKRYASLYLTVLLIVAWIGAYFFARFAIHDLFLVPVALALAIIAVWQRRIVFPYRLSCERCGKPLAIKRILYNGSNACESCDPDTSSDKESDS